MSEPREPYMPFLSEAAHAAVLKTIRARGDHAFVVADMWAIADDVAAIERNRGRQEGRMERVRKESVSPGTIAFMVADAEKRGRERVLAAVTAIWGEDHAKQLADGMAYLRRRIEEGT
jgi:hypothetical protein